MFQLTEINEYNVTLSKSGESCSLVEVTPSILVSIQKQGITVPFACAARYYVVHVAQKCYKAR